MPTAQISTLPITSPSISSEEGRREHPPPLITFEFLSKNEEIFPWEISQAIHLYSDNPANILAEQTVLSLFWKTRMTFVESLIPAEELQEWSRRRELQIEQKMLGLGSEQNTWMDDIERRLQKNKDALGLMKAFNEAFDDYPASFENLKAGLMEIVDKTKRQGNRRIKNNPIKWQLRNDNYITDEELERNEMNVQLAIINHDKFVDSLDIPMSIEMSDDEINSLYAETGESATLIVSNQL